MPAQPLVLVDSASMYFRAFHALPSSMTASDGRPVNAVRGFLDVLARLVVSRRPSGLVCCWDDAWRPSWRVELVPSYKTHRVAAPDDAAVAAAEEVPDDLAPQVDMIRDALEALGLARIGYPDHEADDVIGTLATRHDGPVEVMSGDRDLFQLVEAGGRVIVLYPRGGGGWDEVDDAAVRDRYGLPASSYADFALLRGDPSDGLPGVKGVGEKTASRLLAAHGSVPGVLAAARDPQAAITPAVRASLLAAEPYLVRASAVVRVVRDLPLGPVDTALPRRPRDEDRWRGLVDGLGLSGSAERLERALAGQPTDE